MTEHYILDAQHELVPIQVWHESQPSEEALDGQNAVCGQVIDQEALFRWADWFEKDGNRIVRQEHIGPYLVRTLFLGFDHQTNPDCRPEFFETVVIDRRRTCTEPSVPLERYYSWKEAIAGHEAVVKQIRDHATDRRNQS